MVRRALLAFVALLIVGGSVAPAYAAARGERHAIRRQLRLLQTHHRFAHVAVRDVDNDGDLDILAAPRDGGGVVLWRNAGHGRFKLAVVPPTRHGVHRQRSRFVRVQRSEDGWQCGDERYDAAMPRAPAAAAASSSTILGLPPAAFVPPSFVPRSSGRAPPLA
jgi:hypothetical protein